MGKKNDTLKPATASAAAPAPKQKATPKVESVAAAPAIPEAAIAATAVVSPKKAPVKRKPAARKKKATVAVKPVTFSTEDIALRAYFIAENRHRNGIHGDEHSDWIEAERQLKLEQGKKKRAAKSAASGKKA